MKKRKRVVIAGSVVLIFFMLIIYVFFVKTDTIKVTWMPTPDVQEQINEYIKAGYCIGGYVAEDYTYAEIRLSTWQRYKWLTFLDKDIVEFVERANEINHMKFQVSSDTKEMIVYADREVNFQTLATYLGIIAWDIEMIQILNGEESWGFEFIVKDLKTEKVLYSALCPPGRMRVFESMWDGIEE